MVSNYSIRNSVLFRGVLVSGFLAAMLCIAGGAARQAYGSSRATPSSFGATAIEAAELGVDSTGLVSPAVLRIEGKIAGENRGHILVDLEFLQTLTHHSIATSTAVTDGVLRFDGVLMRDLLRHVGARGKIVTATALNGYEVKIPVQDFDDFDVLLAWAADGEPLQVNDKGPFWIVYPRDKHKILQDIRYDYRWVWQLRSLRVH